HHSLEVVCKDVQAHFGAYMMKCLHEEVRRTHPVLQRSEDMLNRPSSHFHGLRLAIQATLHCIKYRLMFPAPHATLVSRRALSLEPALRADVRPVEADVHAALEPRLVPPQALAGRAQVFIVLGDVDEVELAEAPFGLAVGRHWFGDERLDA